MSGRGAAATTTGRGAAGPPPWGATTADVGSPGASDNVPEDVRPTIQLQMGSNLRWKARHWSPMQPTCET